MNIKLLILLNQIIIAHTFKLNSSKPLEITGTSKTIILRPTNTTLRYGNRTVEKVPLTLPNSLPLASRLSHRHPVLALDLGTKVGLSFNFEGEFELFESTKFRTYRQLVAKILVLIRQLTRKYVLDGLIVAVGFPFLPSSTGSPLSSIGPGGTGDEGGLEGADLRMLFQILYTLDFSCYLAHYFSKVFDRSSNNIAQILGSEDGFGTWLSRSIVDDEVITKCLYCSIFNTPTATGSPYSQSEEVCRTTGKSCLQSFELSKMSHVVLGVSEHLSTYQNPSLSSSSTGITTIDKSEGKKFLNKDSLSSLNIYYNLLPSDSSKSVTNSFLILPNRTNVFNANSKHSNILLYRRIKSQILSRSTH